MTAQVFLFKPLFMFRGHPFTSGHSDECQESMRSIALSIAGKYGITIGEIRGAHRGRKYAWPRQEAYAVCRRTGLFSYPQIGRYFGGRDHTTVLYGARMHERRVAAMRAAAMKVAAE